MASSPFNSVDEPKIDNVGNISGLNYKQKYPYCDINVLIRHTLTEIGSRGYGRKRSANKR